MTEITKLLNEAQKEKFDRLMYGVDGKNGMFGKLSAWAGINDTGIDCTCCLLLLKEEYDFSDAGNNQVYRLYCAMMDSIEENHPDILTSGSVFNRDVFAKFVNAYPQIIGGTDA